MNDEQIRVYARDTVMGSYGEDVPFEVRDMLAKFASEWAVMGATLARPPEAQKSWLRLVLRKVEFRIRKIAWDLRTSGSLETDERGVRHCLCGSTAVESEMSYLAFLCADCGRIYPFKAQFAL